MHSKQKRSFKAAVALLLCLTLTALPSLMPPAQAADSISQNEQKKKDLEQKSQQLDKELEEAKKDTADAKKQKEAYDKKIQNVQQQIDLAQAQIDELDGQINAQEEKIKEKQKEIDEGMEKLKDRLRAIYMAGETSTLDIVLGAKDFNDFLDKAALVKNISKHDSALIEQLQQSLSAIADEKASIEEKRQQTSDTKKELEQKQAQLSELLEESTALYQKLQKAEKAVQDNLDENDAELKQIEAQIKKYYDDQKASSSSGSGGSGGSGGSSIGSGPKNYAWPVPGYTYLSSYWGDGRNHKAIDIAGSQIYGKRVVAAQSGKVILASAGGWGGGYGTYLIIDHGNGYSTLYGHLSRLAVSKGATVTRGQTVGYVGSTGYSTGPHLHFETRKNGVQYNPLTEYNR